MQARKLPNIYKSMFIQGYEGLRRMVLISTSISPFDHILSLFVCPGIEVGGLYSRYMCPHSSVNS